MFLNQMENGIKGEIKISISISNAVTFAGLLAVPINP